MIVGVLKITNVLINTNLGLLLPFKLRIHSYVILIIVIVHATLLVFLISICFQRKKKSKVSSNLTNND